MPQVQPWKAPSVEFLEYSDNGTHVHAAADLLYAYEWEWTPPWPTISQYPSAPWEQELSDPRDLGWPDNPAWLPNTAYAIGDIVNEVGDLYIATAAGTSGAGGVTAPCLYQGKVVHQRHRPKTHRLEYKVFSMYLDLDELPSLDRSLRLFGYNRRSLFSFLDRDHGTGDGGDLKRHVLCHLREAGIAGADGPIHLLCYPRVLGYVFNPLSVFYCYDKGERLRAIIYEVNNTHGERHSYVVPVDPGEARIRHCCDKVFFVSPFLPMDCRYRFHINRPEERLRLFIHETHQGQPILDAWFTGERKVLTDRTLAAIAVTIPLLTFKIMLGIHWEALKLWRKGLPIFGHQSAPKYDVSYIEK